MNCRRCKKSFRQTSWTRSRWLIQICPPCVLELVLKVVAADPAEAEKTGFSPTEHTEK